MEPFSRTIKLNSSKVIPYNSDVSTEILYKLMTHCHWGALKLFYSEFEFLTIISKHLNLADCLIVYIGAQPGWRVQYMYRDIFFPNSSWLLYDPMPFLIEPSEHIIIKTGTAGFFDDTKIDEVKKIAAGRKIVLINDMRFSDPGTKIREMKSDVDNLEREAAIYRDLVRQQRWGILLDAEFMLLKFRMFFFEYNPREINFIDNPALVNGIHDKIIFDKTKKFKSKHRFMLYFSGKIYTQLFAGTRSTESRLIVKKIKYYNNKNKYKNTDFDKYKLKYYDNLKYDGRFNYFNIHTRNSPATFKQSDELATYLPGRQPDYLLASEYNICYNYLKNTGKEPSFANILKTILIIHSVLGTKYDKSLLKCILSRHFISYVSTKYKQSAADNIYKQVSKHLDELVTTANKQFDKLKRTDIIDKKIINDFVEECNNKTQNFVIQDGQIKIISYELTKVEQHS